MDGRGAAPGSRAVDGRGAAPGSRAVGRAAAAIAAKTAILLDICEVTPAKSSPRHFWATPPICESRGRFQSPRPTPARCRRPCTLDRAAVARATAAGWDPQHGVWRRNADSEIYDPAAREALWLLDARPAAAQDSEEEARTASTTRKTTTTGTGAGRSARAALRVPPPENRTAARCWEGGPLLRGQRRGAAG